MFKKIILSLIKTYQKIFSPDTGAVSFAINGFFSFWPGNGSVSRAGTRTCRFNPSCSEYAYQAVEKFGVGKGLALAAKRIACCHPFNAGGYDPVEEK